MILIFKLVLSLQKEKENMDDSVPYEQQKNQQQAYKKIKILGEGSMGRAYLVQSINDDQLYVMKRINIGYLSTTEKQNAMRQAKLHSSVIHENVIAFKQIYHTTKEKLCIVMEYAEGGDLDAFITSQNGKVLSQDQILNYFSQICLGLRAIHQKKIVHRDLKGANIFLSKNHKVKIGDFGISKVIDQTVQASKSFVGTPYYLSPEMVQGKPYSNKADIWALGVILYHLCTQKLPFEANSLPLLALKILKGSFSPVTGNYSKQLKGLILSLLQVNAKKRPSVDDILVKPLLSKYVPKDQILRPAFSASLSAPTKPIKAINKPTSSKSKQKLKPRLSQEQRKNQEKQKREEAKQKRDQLRNQMKEDLKKKRKQKEPTQEEQVVNENKKKIEKPVKKVQEQKITEEKVPKKDAPKPWKSMKPASKKDVQIQMFLPTEKPKSKPQEETVVIPPQNDFKVEIYVSNKNFSTPQIINEPINSQESSQEDDDSPKSQQKSSMHEFREDIGKNTINDVLNQVNGAKLAVQGLGNEYNRDICLYEDSQNFDTFQLSQSEKSQMLNNEDDQSLKYINNSQNLEQCRQILEEGLGEQNFIKSYNILNEHLQQSNERRLKGEEMEDYTFNRQVIKQKLPFLQENLFSKYIILLYTLIILQDEEMKKNLEIDD